MLGWWDYFLVAFLLKTPTGSLFLIGAALAVAFWWKPLQVREILFLLIPAILFFAALTRVKVNIGLRYALPVYPLLYVFASRVATLRFRSAWAVPALVCVPLALTAFSTLRVAPHQLAYFNELAGGPGRGYRYLSDSNIDWGQDLKGLQAYMARKHLPMIYLAYFGMGSPEAFGIHYQYVSGFGSAGPTPELVPLGAEREMLAISVNELQSVFVGDRDRYRWLKARKPVAKIGYSIYVYDLTKDADGHFHLAEVYEKSNQADRAAHELKKVLTLQPENSFAKQHLQAISPRAGA
jgi:hypothetical protein